MTVRNYVRSLMLASLVVMALGGFLLHIRVHPLTHNISFIVNVIAGILSIVVIPLLFLYKSTVHYGYVLNGFITIIATITMAHFSLANLPSPLNAQNIILKTTLADILIVWGKFFVGKALFDLEIFGYNPALEKKGISWRYPNLGWWLVHAIAVAIVYWAGHVFWR
ncbi:MAG: hypothetical protein ACYDHW_13055 [Syntrophorhabdaceae bacterium]